MKLHVDVVSEGRVKPSSPTPANLRRYDMSFLDQVAPRIYMPIVLFFPSEPEPESESNRQQQQQKLVDQFKSSLSEALTLYYPFAGTLRESELAVDCDDAGAYFVQARTELEISAVLGDPDPNELGKLLAVELDDEKLSEIPVAVMVTSFACGGLTVSLCVNHRVADALTFFTFISAWSAVSRGESDVTPPQFGAGKIFPAKDVSGFMSNAGIVKDANELVARRFVFDSQKIEELRTRYEDKKSGDTRRPTRVEALSAFMWSQLVTATKPKDDDNDNRVCTMLHAVNLRPRTDPPLPNNFFGNISRIAVSVPPPPVTSGAHNNNDSAIIAMTRDSIKKIDSDFVKSLRDEDSHMSFLRQRLAQFNRGEIVSLSFTSLCRFPIYETDFGWGKPAFVGSVRLKYKNLVSFFDTKSGDGIEAWVNLTTDDMARFEVDDEILAYASARGKSVF